MKKIYSILAVLATFTFAFSCAKVAEEEGAPEKKLGTFEYQFRINKEGEEATKTTLDGTAVKWEISDKIGVYSTSTVNAFGEIATLNPVVFPVKLNAAITAGTKVYCYYPFSNANDEIAVTAVKMSIPATQTGDFDAMPQVSIPFEATVDMAAGTTNVNDIYFCNLGSVLRFYVFSSGGAYTGETVESVKFISETAIAGNFTLNLSAVDYDDPSTLAISGYTAKTLTVNAAPAIGTSTGNAGTVDAVVAPGTYYGKIVVTTNAARYVYNIAEANKFTVARSAIKNLAVNLESANCTRAAIIPAGELFVPTSSIANGDVILLTSGNTGTVKAMGYQKDSNRDAVEVELDNGALITTASMYPVTAVTGKVEAAYFSLYDGKSDGYLYAASSSANHLKTQANNDVNSEWQIVLNASGQATRFQAEGSSNRKYLRFNSTLFSCYSSASNSPVYVYKRWTGSYVAAADKDIAYNVTSVEIPYTVYNGSGATTATFKTNPSTCASSLAVDEVNKKVTFTITTNDGALRTVEVNITNNGFTKTVAVNQAAEPTKLVMTSIGTNLYEDKINFYWSTVTGATGYKVSTDGGVSYGDTQTSKNFLVDGLTPLTERTIYVKAIGDGVFYTDSDPVSKTATTLAPQLSLPTSITWTSGTKTVSWTDTNTGNGTYGADYKYMYSLDGGTTSNEVSTSTTAVLEITETTTIKLKAVALNGSHRSSDWSDGVVCSVGAVKYYTKITTLGAIETGKKYLIINESHNGFAPYSSGGPFSATDLSGAYDSVNDKFNSTDSDVASCALTIEAPYTSVANSYKMKMSNNKYICKSGADGTAFTAAVTTPANNTVDFVFSIESGHFRITSQGGRALIWRAGTQNKFGMYGTGNVNGTEYFDVYLYKLED